MGSPPKKGEGKGRKCEMAYPLNQKKGKKKPGKEKNEEGKKEKKK